MAEQRWRGHANVCTHRHTHMRAHLILDFLVGFSSRQLPCVCSLHLSLQTSQHTSTVAAPASWQSHGSHMTVTPGQKQGKIVHSHMYIPQLHGVYTTIVHRVWDHFKAPLKRLPSKLCYIVQKVGSTPGPWCIPCLQFLYHCWNLNILDVTTNKPLHN